MVAGENRGTGDASDGVLRIDVSAQTGWVIVAFAGDLDVVESPAARSALDDAAARAAMGVIADLSGLVFLGSTGARTLLEAAAAARAAGRPLRFVQGTGPARRLLQLLGLGDQLDVIDRG